MARMQFQIPKGTFDILPYGTDELWRLSAMWQQVESVIRKTAGDYGYREIRTPIYERTELFVRSAGETTDIVSKEMFTFLDRGGRSISLRPEGTASVMRAYIENHLGNWGAVHKLFYIGPMFRYERPQSGRYRQHHQFGVEAIGVSSPEQDAEVIDLLLQVYTRLNLKNLKVLLNTVGDAESREAFREAFLAYLRPHFGQLSAESQVRFEKNPLRILDSKAARDREILKEAPSILNFLSKGAQEHFDRLCSFLDCLGVPYQIDPTIVRGLDYYNKTVFEVVSEDLGAQGTVGAGGRFDGLVASLGGGDIPAVGFATGMERLLQVMAALHIPCARRDRPHLYFIPLGEPARKKCMELATVCRHAGVPSIVEMHAQKIQAALTNAVKAEALHCAIIGSDEMEKGCVQIKNMHSRETRNVSFDHFLTTILKEMAHV